MFSNVVHILPSHALVERLGFATIVAIKSSPDHVPFLLRVVSALKPASHIMIVYSDKVGLELFAVNNVIAVCDLVPNVVYFLLVSFSGFFAARLVFRDAHLLHECFMSLLLRISEGLLPLPYIVLQWCEEAFLTFDLLL